MAKEDEQNSGQKRVAASAERRPQAENAAWGWLAALVISTSLFVIPCSILDIPYFDDGWQSLPLSFRPKQCPALWSGEICHRIESISHLSFRTRCGIHF